MDGVPSKSAKPKRASARDRLLAASDELFYRDGVHTTGIDAIIERAGVAKGSLYYNFASKDELVAAYLRGQHETWRTKVEDMQAAVDDPGEKILVIFDAIADYASLPDYRGCPFINAAAETPVGEAHEQATKEFRGWLRDTMRKLALQTGVADPNGLVDALVVLYDGAITTAAMDHTASAAARTAKGIARVTLAVAKTSSTV
jgi:AcrR family transcriptional regulator